jgi:hypothetical protein
MTKTDFINRVLLIMNEAGMTDVQGNSFLGADAANIDRYIEGSYENGWRVLAATPSTPKSWLTNKEFISYPIVANLAKGTGYIPLPKDFYLLTALKMKGWQKAISEVSVETELVSAIQSNPYTQGSIIRPVGTTTNEFLDIPETPIKVLGDIAVAGASNWSLNALHYFLDTKKIHSINEICTYKGIGVPGSYIIGDVVLYNNRVYRCNTNTSASIPNVAWTEIVGTDVVLGTLYVDGAKSYVGTSKGLVEVDIENNAISQVLNYYTLSKGLSKHEIEKAIYVPNVTPLIDLAPDAELVINQRLIEPLAYITAGCVCTIFQKDQLAANLTEKGLLMIPGYKSVKGTNVTIKQ